MSDLVRHEFREPDPITYTGFIARADLLPKEVRDRAAMRGGRRLAVLLIILAAVVVGAGYAFVSTLAVSAELQLAAAQAKTIELNQQQGEYQTVRDLQGEVAIAGSVERVGTATAVGWLDLVNHLVTALPEGADFTALTISVDSPLAAVPVLATPLAAPRIGAIQLTAVGPDLVALTVWLDGLRADPLFSAIDVSEAVDAEGWRVTVAASVSPSLTALPDDDADATGANG
jgi:hypothetical protein